MLWRAAIVIITVTELWSGSRYLLAQTARDAEWAEDIAYLVEQLESRHPNLYHSVDRGMFRAEAQRISAAVRGLEDHEMMVEVQRLVSLVGDGHTTTAIEWDPGLPFHDYAVEFLVLSDGIVVVGGPLNAPALAGARVLMFDQTPWQEALRRTRDVASRDNAFSGLEEIADYLRVGEILKALRITDRAESMRMTFETPEGIRDEVTIQAMPRQSADPSLRAADWATTVPWLARRSEAYWLTPLSDGRGVYVAFKSADVGRDEQASFDSFCAETGQAIPDGGLVVVDLRWNTGGSFQRVQCLINTLVALERLRGARLSVLIGNRTFSAAVLFAAELARHTSAEFVGVPTGGKPNHFAGRGTFRLPNSGMTIAYSNAYWQSLFPGDERPAIMPDVVVETTVQAVWDREDEVLDVALAAVPRPSISSVLRPMITTSGVDSALAEYRTLVTQDAIAMTSERRN